MAALPLQGFAAVLKLACGSVHGTVLSQSHGGIAHSHNSLNTHNPHVVLHAHDHALHLQAAADFSADAQPGSPDAAVSACAACVTCCTGVAALPATAFEAQVNAAPRIVLLFPSAPQAEYVPAGLERPPKPISA